MRGEEPGAEMAPSASPTWSPKDQKEGQMVVGSMDSPKHSNTNEPGRAECGCGSQVRKLRARKEFWCPGRRCMDHSRYVRGTAMLVRRRDGSAS